jgi:5,10-methylenetetrahydromethanopterin reductase
MSELLDQSGVDVRFGFVKYNSDGLEEFCPLVERLGGSLITFADGSTLFHDPYVCATVAAVHSRRLMVGPVVTPPGTRHPSVVANSISTVQAVSGGRAFVTLGTGDFALSALGIAPARLAELERFTVAVRGLCRGEEITWEGNQLATRWTPEHPVPVWLAGDGPKLLALAGRVADGVVSGNSATPDHVGFVLDGLASGARSVGRDPATLESWHTIRMHVAASERAGIDEFAFNIGRYIFNRYKAGLENKGATFTEELAARVRGFLADYDEDAAYGGGADAHNAGGEVNARLMEKWELTEWAGRQFVLTGPEELIAVRLRELINAGARNIRIPITLTEPLEFVRRASRIVQRALSPTRVDGATLSSKPGAVGSRPHP